jgi:hypothetical protein
MDGIEVKIAVLTQVIVVEVARLVMRNLFILKRYKHAKVKKNIQKNWRRNDDGSKTEIKQKQDETQRRERVIGVIQQRQRRRDAVVAQIADNSGPNYSCPPSCTTAVSSHEPFSGRVRTTVNKFNALAHRQLLTSRATYL